ncbi:MAG: tetratricopeptide repeat protein, partial [Chitinophagaceae bacterium]
MRKFKMIFLVLPAVFAVNILFAQSRDEGKKFLYYERNNSAISTLGKVVATNPADIEAVYWLGQAHLAKEDVEGAKKLYQQSLAANSSAPLLLVGMGHIELIEGKKNEARNRFETAISLSKGKEPAVYNAIARANVEAKAGDPAYAVDKAKLAVEKDKKSAEYSITLGDAYRKMT